MPSDAEERAIAIAAERSGMSPQQIAVAVKEYRAATEQVEDEPEWRALMHMTFSKSALAQYAAEGTAVTFQVESHKKRNEWEEIRYYVFDGQIYEYFAEARAAELIASGQQAKRSGNVVSIDERKTP